MPILVPGWAGDSGSKLPVSG